MAIRSRVIIHRIASVAADQNPVVIGAVRMPKAGKIKSINIWAGAQSGSNAHTVGVYKAGAAGATAANSTTLVHSAVVTVAGDTPVAAVVNSDGTQNFLEGEWIYTKVVTGATTTFTNLNVTIEVDY